MEKKGIFKVGDKVFDIIKQEWGIVKSTDDNDMYPIKVSFRHNNSSTYTVAGLINDTDKLPRLSFVECTFMDGKFTQERPLPKIEKDTPIYVMYNSRREWCIRYFSHFEGNKAVCFDNQKTSKETLHTTSWKEWSITNPLIKE